MFMADFIYNSQNLNSQNVKTIQRFIHTKMDKAIIVYLNNGILVNNKKNTLLTDKTAWINLKTINDVNECRCKRILMYHFISRKSQEQANLSPVKQTN